MVSPLAIVKVLLLLTVLTLAPAILVTTTSFTRIIVVFGFLRQAMATQQSPPNQVLVSLALFLTFFIMMPTALRVNEEAIQPYRNGEIETVQEAIDMGLVPIRDFMFSQIEGHPKDLALFIEIAGMERPQTRADVPTHVIIPAFIISELKTGFEIGFLLYMPFLILDLVVASLLLSMGMMMLPPVLISLPFKVMLFVLVDSSAVAWGSSLCSCGSCATAPPNAIKTPQTAAPSLVTLPMIDICPP